MGVELKISLVVIYLINQLFLHEHGQKINQQSEDLVNEKYME